MFVNYYKFLGKRSMSNSNNDNYENNSHEISTNLEENLTEEQLHQKIADLQKDLLAAESKATDNWDLLLRAKADEENARRRFRLELENAHKYSIEKIARNILNVVDSLESGIESSSKIGSADNQANDSVINSLKDGMELTLKLLLNNLEEFGIKMVNPVGEMFNPVLHEALSINKEGSAPENSIITVIQKGFMIHDRVLRPARVIVAKQS